MKIGRRKRIGGLYVLTAAALATASWIVWGTAGLVAATLVTVTAGNILLAFLLIETRRQLSAQISKAKAIVVPPQADMHDAEQAEKLLRAIDSRLTRTELSLRYSISEREALQQPPSGSSPSAGASEDQPPTTS